MGKRLFDQTVLTDREAGIHGDCMAACVKTILQDELEGVPHPVNPAGGWNFGFFDEIEARHKVQLHYQPNRPGKDMRFMGRLVIAAGPTSRTEKIKATHAVVWDIEDGCMVHDPHPSRSGLLHIDGYYFLGSTVEADNDNKSESPSHE